MTWTPMRVTQRSWGLADENGDFRRSVPCHYAPRGRVISYRNEHTAQKRADALNERK